MGRERLLVALSVLVGAAVATAREPGASFAPMLRAALPAVVNIAAAGRDEEGDPRDMQDVVRRHGSGGEGRSLGSGFILTADGDIVTNSHVVQGVGRLRVRLGDDEYDARLIGADERTDIALLRVSAPRALPTLPLGDSDGLEVGDWVLALGNPLALVPVASAGIVGAKGHVLGIGRTDDFIQTDAPTSPLASGGPLVDVEGHVVGVTVGEQGPVVGAGVFGFAVPINVASRVIAQLRDAGRVVRGWIGVDVQPVTPELAYSFGLRVAEGALVADVDEDGPAARARIQRGDVIVRWGDRPIRQARELPALVSESPPDAIVPVGVLRDGQERTVDVTVGELPLGARPVSPSAGANESTLAEWGLVVRPLSDRDAKRRGLKPGTGVLIVDVEELSPADDAGLEADDVIVQANRQAVHTLAELKRALASKPSRALLLVRRGTASIYVELER